VRTSDGIRLRVAVWDGPRMVLLLTGRSEHIEKYGHVVARLRGLGYGVVSFDWRGQGLSDRLLDDTPVGYVRDYAEYQQDITAALGAPGMHGKQVAAVIGHSMGGLVALEYLAHAQGPQAAVLIGPLMGLKRQSPIDWLLHLIARLAAHVGFGKWLLPGGSLQPTVIVTPFEGNPLMRNAARYAQFRNQLMTYPALGVGGASLRWVAATMTALRRFRRAPMVRQPMLILMGGSEDVVSVPAVRAYAAQAAHVRLVEIADAEHEILMETPEVEAQAWPQIAEFLATHAPVLSAEGETAASGAPGA
jgi:lysophospholipase